MLRYIDQEDDNYSSDQVAGLDLRGLYQKADKALGGWLPGGGTGNPLSKPVQQAVKAVTTPPVAELKPLNKPYARIPGAKPEDPALTPEGALTKGGKEVLKQLGINPSVTSKLAETNPIAQLGAEMGYLGAAHANPFKNQIYIPNSNLNTLAVLAHEAGHLDQKQRSGKRPPLEGVFGQALNVPATAVKEATGGELSPFAQLLAPLRILGGGLTAYSDAHEEDHAEKYTHRAMLGMTGMGQGAIADAGTPTTPSIYSQNLHSTGLGSAATGVVDLLMPPPLKALAMGVQAATEGRQQAGPPAPKMSKFELQQLAIMTEADLIAEQRANPNSRLIPRLKQIADQAKAALAQAGD
jgi:hypothetical protein